MRIAILCSFIFLFFISATAQVVINEYSCSNFKKQRDNFGKFEDWFELYNTSATPADISGFYVSDKNTNLMKWQFPVGTVIPGNGFLLIWASNKDTVVTNTHYHTNFKLTQTGSAPDRIYFSNASGSIESFVVLNVTQKNHSYGRITDGTGSFAAFTSPTPGASNSTATALLYATTPSFSINGGFYTSAQTLTITTSEVGGVIRYTTDGKDPVSTSSIYSTPLSITTTTIVKARVFVSGKLPGFVEYGTFFINESHVLPVVSVAADSLEEMLNDLEEGGFYWSETKPEGTFEYYDKNKVLQSKIWGEYNRHGQDSWSCDQRSMDFVARDEMGYGKAIEEKLFANSDREEFQTVILRASGDDNYPCAHNSANEGSAHMRDGYVHNLAKRGDMHLDVRNSERIIIYVNGKYWGVYEVRERPDDHDYTEYHYNQSKENLQYVLTWGITWAEYGGDKAIEDFEAMQDFIQNNNMALPANYKIADSLLNFKSLADYIIVNNMTVCTDWLNYNTGTWRGLNRKGDHKKWGYILWDNDATFDFYINYTGVPSTQADAPPCDAEEQQEQYDDPEGHLELLSKLMENDQFKQFYRTRQADLLNTVFSCSNMLGYLDEYTALIDPEMTRHASRWSGTYSEWKANVARLRGFIEDRCVLIETGMKDCYNLTGPYELTVNATPGGTVKVNSLALTTFPWVGKYYGGIKTDLIAKPLEDGSFVNWTGDYAATPNALEDSVNVTVNASGTITANFLTTSTINPDFGKDKFYMNIYPSVVSSTTNLEFNLPVAEQATIEVFDIEGNKILSLQNKDDFRSVGVNIVTLDLSKSNLSQGLYIVKVRTNSYSAEKKIVYAP